MKFTITCMLVFASVLSIAQPKDEFVFENGEDNVVFTETLELGREQAFVPAGFYFGWLLSTGMQSDVIMELADYTLEEFNSKESTGPELFMTDWEGVLTGELMNDDAYRFSRGYYLNKEYEQDLQALFNVGSSSIYSIEDTWENFELVRAKLDARFADYKARSRGNR